MTTYREQGNLMEREQAMMHATLSLLSSLIDELRESSVLEGASVETIFDNAIKQCLTQENTDGADMLRKLRR